MGLTRPGQGNKEAYNHELMKTFFIFGDPFEAVGADDRDSRRDGCISMGRVRPRSAPRGPGDIWELFSEVGLFGKIFQSDTLKM